MAEALKECEDRKDAGMQFCQAARSHGQDNPAVLNRLFYYGSSRSRVGEKPITNHTRCDESERRQHAGEDLEAQVLFVAQPVRAGRHRAGARRLLGALARRLCPVPVYDAPLPWLTKEQMAEVDRLMVDEARILLLQMMESAGRHLAHLARVRFLGGDPRGRTVVVLAGTGGNGGGALVAARRLGGWGARVKVVVTSDDACFAEVPAISSRWRGTRGSS
jgi:hypothetical protein